MSITLDLWAIVLALGTVVAMAVGISTLTIRLKRSVKEQGLLESHVQALVDWKEKHENQCSNEHRSIESKIEAAENKLEARMTAQYDDLRSSLRSIHERLNEIGERTAKIEGKHDAG